MEVFCVSVWWNVWNVWSAADPSIQDKFLPRETNKGTLTLTYIIQKYHVTLKKFKYAIVTQVRSVTPAWFFKVNSIQM